MSNITVTELQGHTSGGDANKVKIKTGHELEVVDGNVTISDDFKFTVGATPTLGIGTLTPNRKLVVSVIIPLVQNYL